MSRHRSICAGVALSMLAGCAGVTPLVESDPVRVMAEPPPPPPPPEPPPPPPPPPVVEVTREEVQVHQTIHFAFDSDVILEESYPLMDEIVSVVQEHQEIRRLKIEGHTDSSGRPEYNMELSNRRAASVMRYMVEHGIDEARLSSEGFGVTRPIASNDTDEGRAQNRRVEFKILERDDSLAPPAEPAPAEEASEEAPAAGAEEPAATESEGIAVPDFGDDDTTAATPAEEGEADGE